MKPYLIHYEERDYSGGMKKDTLEFDTKKQRDQRYQELLDAQKKNVYSFSSYHKEDKETQKKLF